MANEGRLLLTVNNSAPTYQSAFDTSAAGSWNNKTISARAVAWKSSDESDPDLAGVVRSAVAGWDNQTIPASKTLSFSVVVPSADSWDHIGFVYQTASSFDASASANICTATVQYTSQTQAVITVPADDDTDTITLGASATEIGLNPVWIDPVARDNIALALGGDSVYRRSYPVELEFALLNLALEAGSITQANLNKLRKWAQYAVKLTADDGDTNARIGTYHGSLLDMSTADSLHKNRNYPAFKFLITGEDYN